MASNLANPYGAHYGAHIRDFPNGVGLPPDRSSPYAPRRISNASESTASYMTSRTSMGSHRRSASYSSHASYDSYASPYSSAYTTPLASPRPPHHSRHSAPVSLARPKSLATFRRRPPLKPGEMFATLPPEVLELIMQHLEDLHLAAGSLSCATCWMRDCCSVALSTSKWLKHARVALYGRIQLNGQEGAHMKKRLKGLGHGRLVLLRRTLRSSPQIAAMVRSLKVPNLIPAGSSLEDYHDLVASLVMECPNLERLVGFYPAYKHVFSRLFHALSSRSRLKEMDWIIEPPAPRQLPGPTTQTRASRAFSFGSAPSVVALPTPLAPDFLAFYDRWPQLTSLMLHCVPGPPSIPESVLVKVFRSLPSLQNLHLSHLPETMFCDMALLALPELQQLAMVSLPGVTAAGLSMYASTSARSALSSLTLINIRLDSLPALARILSNMRALQSLSIVQNQAPVMPSDEVIWLFPYLASASITKLHWDMPQTATRASAADSILAKSISAGGFPALRSLRAPHDPEGLFQALCRPQERADHPRDRYHGGAHTRTGSFAPEHGRKPSTTPDNWPPFPGHSNLRQSRLAAQARIEAARHKPRFRVHVTDEDGTPVDDLGVGAFLGTVGSPIRYDLTPDVAGTDHGGGLVGVAELLGDCGEDLVLRSAGPPGTGDQEGKKEAKKAAKKDREEAEVMTREGCTGRWNSNNTAPADKRERDRWLHTERGRWRPVSVFV